MKALRESERNNLKNTIVHLVPNQMKDRVIVSQTPMASSNKQKTKQKDHVSLDIGEPADTSDLPATPPKPSNTSSTPPKPPSISRESDAKDLDRELVNPYPYRDLPSVESVCRR